MKGRLNEAQLKTLAGPCADRILPLRAPHSAGKNPPNPWYEIELSGVRRDLLRQNLLNMGHRVEKMKRVKLASLERLKQSPKGTTVGSIRAKLHETVARRRLRRRKISARCPQT